MSNVLRIKRRASNESAAAPGNNVLRNAELAFNEASNTLYYGRGGDATGANANATPLAITGDGTVWTGTATFGAVNTTGKLSVGDEAYAYTNTYPPATTGAQGGKLLSTTEYVDDAVARSAGAGMSLHPVAADCATTVPLIAGSPYDNLQGFSNVKVAVPQPQSMADGLVLYELRGLPTIPNQSVTLVAGDRVLIMGHLDPLKKGIWKIPAGATATTGDWTRETGETEASNFAVGARVFVTNGTYANYTFEVAQNPVEPTATVPFGFTNLNFNANKTTAPSSVPAGGAVLFKRIARAKSDYYQIINGKVVVDGVTLNQNDHFIWTPKNNNPGGHNLTAYGYVGTGSGDEGGEYDNARAGIYRVNYSRPTGGDSYNVIVRARDLNTSEELQLAHNTKVLVREGAVNKNTIFTITTGPSFVMDSNVATFDNATAFNATAGSFAGIPIIDGVQTVEEQRDGSNNITRLGSVILVKNEVDPKTNGLYYIPKPTSPQTAANVTWIRHPSADETGELSYGTYIRVKSGNVNKNSGFVQVTNIDPLVIDSASGDALVFESPQALLDFRAGLGLGRNDRTFYVKTAGSDRIVVTETGVDLAEMPNGGVFNDVTVATDPANISTAYILVHADKYGRVTAESKDTITATELRNAVVGDVTTGDTTGTGDLVFSVSPAFTGAPTAPTQTAGDNSTNIATTEFVTSALSAGGGSQLLAADNTWTGSNTFRKTTGTRFEQAATQDAIVVTGRNGGNSSYEITLTPATLSADRTITLPDATTTLVGHDVGTGTATSSFATGATANATTKTVNIGPNGVSGSTTAVNIGSTSVNGAITNLTIGATTTTGFVDIKATTGSTSTTTGALIVRGGAGIVENLFVGGNVTISSSKALNVSTATSLTAAGTNQATALALTNDVNVVSTVAASTGVVLPTPTIGRKVTVVNRGLNTLNVYPASTHQIDALGANTAITVRINQQMTFIGASATLWYSEATGVSASSYGSTTQVATFTVNEAGQLTAASNTAIQTASTSQSGIVQLDSSTTSTSTTMAATASAVKSAKDAADSAQTTANAALPKAGGTMTGAIVFAAGQTWPTFNQNTTGTASAWATARTVTFAGGEVTGSFSISGAADVANVQLTARAASTSQTGIVQLDSSTTSTSTTMAATASAVKSAKDAADSAQTTANAALPKAGGTMTGTITMRAGTAAAGTAPIYFTSGTSLTAAAAGAMEFDGTNLFFTPSSTRKTVAFTDSTITGNAANVTNTVVIGNGGTGLSSYAVGDMLYYSTGTALSKVAKPSAPAVLFNDNAGTPSWVATTGSDNVVRATSPAFAASVTTSDATFTVFNTNGATSLSAFGGATGTLNVGPTTSGTTLNLASGAMTTGTRTINIGTGATGGTSNVVLGSTGATSTVTVNKDLVVSGNLTVNGTTTTLNTSTVSVDDKNIELGAVVSGSITCNVTSGSAVVTNVSSTANIIVGSSFTNSSGFVGVTVPANTTVASIDSATQITLSAALTGSGSATGATAGIGNASDTTAAGGGITLKGATDKTIIWNSASNGWEFNQNVTTSSATVNVNGSNPTIATTQTTGTAAVFNTNVTTVNVGGVAHVSVGGATANGTSSFASGATVSGATKTVNLGTAAGASSITVVNIGSAVSGAVTNVSVGVTGTTAGAFTINPTTTSSGTTNGALVVGGGVGIGENLNVGGNVTISSGKALNRSLTTGLTAAGTNQATALALTNDINIVTTTASGTGVVLPTPTVGRVVVVINRGLNALNVFPASAHSIDGTANSARVLAANATMIVRGATVTTWFSELTDLANSTTGTLSNSNGGTGQSAYTTGDLLYASAANTLSKLAAPTDSTKILQMTTAGAPSWVTACSAVDGCTLDGGTF